MGKLGVVALCACAALFVAGAPARAMIAWRSLEEVADSSEVIAVGKVTAIAQKAVAGRAWDVATIEIEKVLLDRTGEQRKLRRVELYVAPHREARIIVDNGWPTARVGQHGVWFLEVPPDFVGYRHGHFNYQPRDKLARVEGIIAADRDPAKAMASDDAAKKVAGAYFWWSENGRKGDDKKAEKATREATEAVVKALAAGLDDQPPGDQMLLAQNMTGLLGLPTGKIWGGRVQAADRGRKLRDWLEKNPDFRLATYVDEKADEKN